MRRKDREITDPAAIENIISKAQICYLGMSINDQPYVIPLNFGFEDNTIYIHCASEGKKINIIKKNPQVSLAFSVDAQIIMDGPPQTWTSYYKSVITFGKATIVKDITEKQKGMQIILKHYAGNELDIDAKEFKNMSMIKIEIKSMTGKRNPPQE